MRHLKFDTTITVCIRIWDQGKTQCKCVYLTLFAVSAETYSSLSYVIQLQCQKNKYHGFQVPD